MSAAALSKPGSGFGPCVDERTEIACTSCDVRLFLPGDAITAVEAAREIGWTDAARQFAGRHTVWMVCPAEHSSG
jgi:hypothetical protein